MSRTTQIDTDGGTWSIDHLSTQRWLDGHVAGADAAGAWLAEHALALFRAGDDQAFFVRDLAHRLLAEVVPKLRDDAEKHERDFPHYVARRELGEERR